MKRESPILRQIFPAALSFLGLLALILDAETAVRAAGEGLTMCLQTVVPSLFPFLVASRLFAGSAAAGWCARVLGPVMGPVFGLPPQCAPALVLGAVSGYPVGAQTAAGLYAQGRLDRQSSERLLSFCSNAGPAFLFGMVGGLLGGVRISAILYVIHLISAILTGIVLKPRRGCRCPERVVCGPTGGKTDLTTAVSGGVRTMGLICGYIVLFRVISAFLEKALGLWLPPMGQALLAGFLELAGGCCRLPPIESAGIRYCMASGFLAFGGLCVFLQTLSVIRPAGLTGRYYLFGKMIQSAIAVLLTWGAMVLFPSALPRAVTATAMPLPNHSGLLRATGVVTAIFLSALGIWCLRLRKRAGKQTASDV